jgi:hypothetical protein
MGVQEALIAEFREDSSQLAGHVDASRLFAFGRAESAAIPPALDENVTIRIVLIFAKLKIPPFEPQNLSLSKARTKSD